MSVTLALSLILAAAAGDPAADVPATSAEDQEIIVIARNLEKVQLNVRRDEGGRFHCTPLQSTGLVKLDAQLCEVTVKCVRKGNWGDAAVKQCVEKRKPGLVENIRTLLQEKRALELDHRAQETGA